MEFFIFTLNFLIVVVFSYWLKKWVNRKLFCSQKAQQRIIASYSVSDPNEKIDLLKSAIEIDPFSFNGFNALGYAYLEKGDLNSAVMAFKEAIKHHPKEKEGYYDLAEAHRQNGDDRNHDLTMKQALSLDFDYYSSKG